MMHSPLLTIIIATFNSSATLQKTLDSILSQDWQEWEVLIVDGVSTDNTVGIMEENARRDHRIRFISERDQGVYDAMNKGIVMARGEWVYFLGSDDRLFGPQVLHSVFNEPGLSGFDFVYANVVSPSFKSLYDGEFTFEKLLSNNISHQAIFYKKKIFDRIGNYNLRYRGYADWDLNIRCFADSGIRTKYLEGVIAEFGADGISSRHDISFLQEVLIPEKLRMLNRAAMHSLRSVKAYDEWWRLLRNAAVRDRPELRKYARGENIPPSLDRMVAWQQKIPSGWLRWGPFSKFTMFVNYICNLLTASL
jgi:glycosyltransferase involved in cell wall biosynthesis